MTEATITLEKILNFLKTRPIPSFIICVLIFVLMNLLLLILLDRTLIKLLIQDLIPKIKSENKISKKYPKFRTFVEKYEQLIDDYELDFKDEYVEKSYKQLIRDNLEVIEKLKEENNEYMEHINNRGKYKKEVQEFIWNNLDALEEVKDKNPKLYAEWMEKIRRYM